MAIPYATKNELNRLSNQSIDYTVTKTEEIAGNVPVISNGKIFTKNIYFDTSKSVEEVNEILSKLTYGDGYDFYVPFAINDKASGEKILMLTVSNTTIGLMGGDLKDRLVGVPEDAYDEGTHCTIITLFDSNIEDNAFDYPGWNPGFKENIPDGKVIISDVGQPLTLFFGNALKVGNENEKLVDLIYSEKLEPGIVKTGKLKKDNGEDFFPEVQLKNIEGEIPSIDYVKVIEIPWDCFQNGTQIDNSIYDEIISRKNTCIITMSLPMDMGQDIKHQLLYAGETSKGVLFYLNSLQGHGYFIINNDRVITSTEEHILKLPDNKNLNQDKDYILECELRTGGDYTMYWR